MRQLGMTRIFGNPGSTEVAFLTDLPPDLEFVLGLHEGSVVGMATGYAIARGEPSFVNLHTTPGLGNAVNAIANARDCRTPLVVMVGQQEAVLAADRSLVTVERIVDELSPRPGAVVIPGWVLDAVAEAPGGSRPSYSLDITERDNDFYRRWDAISRDREAFTGWMEENVLRTGAER